MHYKENPPLRCDLFLGSQLHKMSLNWQETILVTSANAHTLWLSAYLLTRLLSLPLHSCLAARLGHIWQTRPCTTLFKLNRREMDGFVTDQGTWPLSGEHPTFSEHSEGLTGTFPSTCTIREQLLSVPRAGLGWAGTFPPVTVPGRLHSDLLGQGMPVEAKSSNLTLSTLTGKQNCLKVVSTIQTL